MRERHAVTAAAALAAVGVVLLVAASAVNNRLEAVETMQVLVPVKPFPAQREFENFEVVVPLCLFGFLLSRLPISLIEIVDLHARAHSSPFSISFPHFFLIIGGDGWQDHRAGAKRRRY